MSAETTFCNYYAGEIDWRGQKESCGSMKIVIFNDELRSEMQMYLALSTHHDVEIAKDVNDLFLLLDQNSAELTFLDLESKIHENGRALTGLSLYDRLVKKYPAIRFVGICDRDELVLAEKAIKKGIKKIIKRPIRNRELIEAIES